MFAKQRENKSYKYLACSDNIKYSFTAAVLEAGIFFPINFIHNASVIPDKALFNIKYVPEASIKRRSTVMLNTDCFKSCLQDSQKKSIYWYPGSYPAIPNKISKRLFLFCGQPVAEQMLSDYSQNVVLNKAASSGAVGAARTLLNPFAFNFRYFGLLSSRNFMESFALFGVPALARSMLFKKESGTNFELISTNMLGAVTSVLASNPFDNIKNNMQEAKTNDGVLETLKKTIKTNQSSLFKISPARFAIRSQRLSFFMLARDKLIENTRDNKQLKY